MFEAVVFGSQAAAELVPVAASNGLRGRLWGSHPYVSSASVASPDDREARAARAAARLPGLLAGFPAAWSAAAAELDLRYERFAAAEPGAPAHALLSDAVVLLRRAWLIHFEFMYPLLEAYRDLLELAERVGVDPQLVPRLLQGYPTRITETDRSLWALARTATELGLAAEMAALEAGELASWLADPSPAVAALRAELDGVVERYGWRTDSVYEVSRPAWGEDVTPLLQRVSRLLHEVQERSFDELVRASEAARRAAEKDALAGLRGSGRGTFAAALERARAANFAWWNEEHNASIDLRAHVPLRRAARRVAARSALADPELVFFLFLPELEELAAERADRRELMATAEARARLHAEWRALRPQLPGAVGRAPDGPVDPVLLEIFGVDGAPPRAPAEDDVLRGLPAAPGRALGRARVLRDPRELAALEPGEILVCEATTPAWTAAFGSIGGCVCSAGGSLTHAAIVSREYGIPCVASVAGATDAIVTGSLIELDGGAGLVRVVRRAPGSRPRPDPGGEWRA